MQGAEKSIGKGNSTKDRMGKGQGKAMGEEMGKASGKENGIVKQTQRGDDISRVVVLKLH